jgi:hypothetical protein
MKSKFKIIGSLFLVWLFAITSHAQTSGHSHYYPGTNSPYAILSNPVLTNLPGAIPFLNYVLSTPSAARTIPVISWTNASQGGAYFSLQLPTQPPLPGNFFPSLPVYTLDATNHIYVVDDRSVDFQALAAQEATNGFGESYSLTSYDLIDTNQLWLEVPTNALPGSNVFTVVIRHTTAGKYYDLLTKTDLTLTNWTVEQTVTATSAATPATLWQNDRTNLFVWARETLIPLYTQPLSQEVFGGDTVTFSVAAGGSGALFYQWTFNGTNIYGATGSSYTIVNANTNNAGNYVCIIHNADGSVTSQTATLTVYSAGTSPFDVITYGQRQDYTFRNGATYVITSPVQLYGKTTIEGGAVIKFDYNYPYPCLQVWGTLDCQGGAYNPAVLTSIYDSTFGLFNGYGAPQAPFSAVPYLDLTYAGDVTLANLRFRYADIAVAAPYHARLEVWDTQFFQCNAGVVSDLGGVDSFHNVLFASCYDAVAGYTNAYAVEMEHVTADVANLCSSTVAPYRVGLTNCIVLGSLGSIATYSGNNVAVNPDVTNFVFSGAGAYYLTNGSPLCQSGTTNISARLLAEFPQKTTAAPLAFPQRTKMSGNLTLMPQVARYAGGKPDLGYYYDALDYTLAWIRLAGSITVEPGTAIGIRSDPMPGWPPRNTWWGFELLENSVFTSHGLPDRMNIVADTQLVQEQDEYASVLIMPNFQGNPDDAAPTLDLRFNRWYAGNDGFHVWGGNWEFIAYANNTASPDSLVNWTMRDCELHGGRISLGAPDIGLPLDYYYGSGAVDWENNLFAAVEINLNPATWWFNGVVNFDEAVTARNNLFIGGTWFILEPVPASAGNWVFTDNLFDGRDFLVNPLAPLDFDHNAYRPLSANQTLAQASPYRYSLTAGDTTTLVSATNNLGGQHEVSLAYPLLYTNGVLGNYYLTTLTPLYQAGSHTASEAGLEEYTTFANQFKDPSNSPVSIGLHYVTTTNSLPLDSDGDGVPDYVEAEHGTDPHNAMTDGSTPDTLNAAYDDVDLSGNGLVGRIKKAIGQNPLDKNNPLTLKQVITGEEPDIATFEVPVSYNMLTNVDGSMDLLVNGESATLSDLEAGTNGYCRLILNTTYEKPGQNHLQAVLSAGVADKDEAITSAVGCLAVYDSPNPVQFFEAYSGFDDSGATLYAEVADLMAADYVLEIKTPQGAHIRSITNSTADGVINEVWDLTDENGNTFAGEEVDAEFTVARANIPLTNAPKQKQKRRKIVPVVDGNFDVAYAYNANVNFLKKDGMFWNQMNGVVDKLLSTRNSFADLYSSTFNWYWEAANPGYPGYLPDRVKALNLLTNLALPETKNFFFYGHGGKNYIGDGTTNASAARLSASEVSKQLQNNFSAKGGFTVKHPYRFVWLDGCSTGSSKEWRHAFGIYSKGKDGQGVAGISGPQVFVGWNKPVGGLGAKGTTEISCKDYGIMLNRFFFNWMNKQPLSICITRSSDKALNSPLPVPGNEYTTYSDGTVWTNRPTSTLYIIGDKNLRRK